MFYLTKHEKGVLLFLAAVVLCGLTMDCVLKSRPSTAASMSADRFVNKTNVNTATFDELVAVPYIGEVTARAIIHYRRKAGKIGSLEEIRALPEIYPSNYFKMVKYLRI